MGKTKIARKPTPTPEDAEPAAKIPRIARKHPLSLPIPARATRIGTLLCCGQNEVGQLGLGEDVSEKTRPAVVAGTERVVDISAGGMHSLYLDAAGSVFSFGCNDEGALGRDSSAEGSEYEIVRVELPGPVVRLSTGDSHSACLLEDGRVLAWGSFRDSHGNMGLTLEGNKRFPVEVVPGQKFVDISSGADHLAMLTTDGKVFTVGCGEQGQLGRVTARSSGGESRRGKTELLQPGQVRFGARTHVMDAIWATTYCTFTRVHGTNEIIAFGLNNYSQLAVPKHTDDLFFTPKPTTIKDVKFISGGQHHTLLLTNDQRCQVIGRRDYGRLGLGQRDEDLKELAEITALSGKRVVQVACGESCSFARTADGLVFAWGIGSNYQLGIGSEDDAYEPVLLTGLQVKGKEVLNVNGGGQHTLLLVASAEEEAKEAAAAKVETAKTKAVANGTAATKANGVKKAAAPSKPAVAEAAKATAEAPVAAADKAEKVAPVAAAAAAKTNGVKKAAATKAASAEPKRASEAAEASDSTSTSTTPATAASEDTAKASGDADVDMTAKKPAAAAAPASKKKPASVAPAAAAKAPAKKRK